MKLVGNLKDQVESANSKEEAREIIEKVGITLDDDELDAVTGGVAIYRIPPEATERLRNQESKSVPMY
jgi:hypothetical protein